MKGEEGWMAYKNGDEIHFCIIIKSNIIQIFINY